MFYRSAIVVCLMGVVIVATFPIEIKDIQYLFPPQKTFLDAGQTNSYHTQIDKQVGDSEEKEKAAKACIPKQNAEHGSEAESESNGSDGTGTMNDGFEDTSPVNGTIVDDPMEVKIYKPECDD